MMEHQPDCRQSAPAPERRTFLQLLTYGLSCVAGVVLSVPLIGYFLGVRPRALEWVRLDKVTEFPVDETHNRQGTPSEIPPAERVSAAGCA